MKPCADCGDLERLPNYAYCRECKNRLQRRRYRERGGHTEAVKARRQSPEHKAATRAYKLQRNYGMTVEEFDARVESQNGLCAICGREPKPTGNISTLVVDHDHVTGAVRGLLCSPCNRALGYFQDDPEVLRAALSYMAGGQT